MTYSNAVMWQLVINGPGYFDTSYDLPQGTTVLGRAEENDVVLSGDMVSRRHARLTLTKEELSFEDLGSRNGCKVNGRALSGRAIVQVGDVLTVGENTLTLRQTSVAQRAATELIDPGGGGVVRRFGQGQRIGGAIVSSKNVRESVVMRLLGNVSPSATEASPFSDLSGSGSHPAAPFALANDGPNQSGTSKHAVLSLVMLYRIAERLSAAGSLNQFLEEASARILERTRGSTCVVLVRHSSGVLVPALVRHAGALGHGEAPVSDAIVEEALEQGAALAVNDVHDDKRFNTRDSVLQYGADQVLCVPIGVSKPFDGVLYINRKSTDPEPVDNLIDVLTAAAQLIHGALQRFSFGGSPGEAMLRQALLRFHASPVVEKRLVELRKTAAPLSDLSEYQLTVLYADLQGFQSLTEKLAPERTADLLKTFYEKFAHTVFSFEGTVASVVGDAAMAIFGAPYSRSDDAVRAVRAALALKEAWREAVESRPPRERLGMKLALNTGKSLAGTVWVEPRLEYVVTGDAVATAAWLCGMSEGGQILISGRTLASIGARFDVNPLGERQLKGTVRTSVFEVLEEDSGAGTVSGVKKLD